ncbi:MAG: M42 family metallopeptidase [Anaerolineales bacterium]
MGETESKRRSKTKAKTKPRSQRRRARLPKAFVARLQQLSEAVSVSGDEGAVRRIVLDAIAGHADDITVDTLGNVFATRKGRGRMHVLAAAHMDEVGVMIVEIDGDGLLRFAPIGGLDPRVLIGKPMWIGPDKTAGVIGASPVHLLRRSEQNSAPKIDRLRIDIGAANKEAAGRAVRPGDCATFAMPFANLGYTLRGKALDDRVGVAILIELLRSGPLPYRFTAAFTVQEEVGLRGARVAANATEPAAAIVLEATPANDLPPEVEGEENVRYNTRLGLGPALSLADAATLHDRRLTQHFEHVAGKADIPFQFRQPGGGGNDAGAIQRSGAGVPSIGISVPARYIHSPAALIAAHDVANTIKLVRAGLEALTPNILKRA